MSVCLACDSIAEGSAPGGCIHEPCTGTSTIASAHSASAP
jgi:hypothetical protein